ncbi:MAG TPA: hypothetical protein PKB00_14115 [Microthrixaceae bacterium]|nr:hypothetical protein [Microthrixaceae bacterium]HNB95654.1 hypothetical protein [Microthrixaceae bacterium]HNH38010.1 hypothetical protein [Microthrixaceae bacterium]
MIPASRFCPVCHQPRSVHRGRRFCDEAGKWIVTRTVSLTVTAEDADDAREQADAYPATAWNIDNEEITSA